MNSILALPVRDNSIPPELRAVPHDAFEAKAVVHVVGFDAEMQRDIGELFLSVGVEIRTHDSLAMFADFEGAETPACMVVRARSALTGVQDFLAHFFRSKTALPMIVAAERADVRMAVLAMKAGAVDFLEHPLRDHDLLEAVGRALRIDYARRQAEAPLKEVQARFATLTPRERQVMLLVAQGRLNKQVAWDLGLSEVTVKVHRGSAMRKMRARTLADLVRMADAVESSELGAQDQFETPPARIAVHAVACTG